jgi:hypothetical protein
MSGSVTHGGWLCPNVRPMASKPVREWRGYPRGGLSQYVAGGTSQEASGEVSHYEQLGGYAQYEAGGRPVSRSGEVCIAGVAMRPHMGLAVSQSVSMLPTADGYYG